MTLRTRLFSEHERASLVEIERLCLTDGEAQLWRIPWLRRNFSGSMAHRIAVRARIVYRSDTGMGPPEIAAELHVGVKMVRYWIKQFNMNGLAALADAERSGRPFLHGRASHKLQNALQEVAYTPPPEFGLPFAHWSPTRLARYIKETRDIAVTAELLAARLKFQDYSEE